jgi:murein L,D-transpeptidase YcbB/YkuD
MNLHKSFSVPCLLACVVMLSLLSSAFAQAPPALPDRVAALIARKLDELSPGGQADRRATMLRALYGARSFRPLWMEPARVRELAAAVEDSRSDGLEPADYRLDWLRLIAAAPVADPATLAERDLLLSDTLAMLVRDLRHGRHDPRRHHVLWNFSAPPDARTAADRLAVLLESGPLQRAVARQVPQLDAYRQLKAGLAQYRSLAAAGGWPPLPSGPSLHPGARSERVPALRARLQASGEMDRRTVAEPDLFDDTLVMALRHFQQRHGLEPDGVLGRATLQALNVGVTQRIAQIIINLERLRWVAQDLAADHVLVDIAGYRASLQLAGEPRWAGRVIVGRPVRQTPVLLDRVRRVVLNPKWVVPPTILRQDVMPAMRRNPAYLDEHRLRIVDADGHTVDPASVDWHGGHFPYRLVQESGAEGSLGQIKFELGNRYSIYLHDTPTRTLFQRAQRAYSSGCVRVQDPLALAVLLLGDAARWDVAGLQAAIDTGTTRVLVPAREIPVLLLYLTAVADEAGVVSFREDVYRHDPALLAALAS